MGQTRRTSRYSRNLSSDTSLVKGGLAATFVGCVGIWAVVIGLHFLLAWAFEDLWNWLMPLIFHLPTLTYWEAFGLLAVLSIVGGFFRSNVTTKD